MEFSVALNDYDYILFNKHVISSDPSTKKIINRIRRIGPITLYSTATAMFMLDRDFGLFLFVLAIVTVLSLVWVLKSEKYFLYSTEKNIRNLIEDGKPLYNNEECVIKFENENIHETSKSVDIKTKYSLIEKVIETENGLYIFNNFSSVYILPTRVFADNEEKQKLLEFINSKIDSVNNKTS